MKSFEIDVGGIAQGKLHRKLKLHSLKEIMESQTSHLHLVKVNERVRQKLLC